MHEKNIEETNVLDLAEGQRHAHLLEKMVAAKVLSRPEVQELRRYEAKIKSGTNTVEPIRPKRRGGKVSLAEVRALGLDCDSLTRAAAVFSGPGDLIELAAERVDVQEAWDRGRLLRKVRDFAATAVSVSDAGKSICQSGQAFRDMLDNDKEVADLWDEQRRSLRVTMKDAMVVQAREGKPYAIRCIERLLRSEQVQAGFDYEHVPLSVMTELLGKKRQTIWVWHTEGGLPRNGDGTFNLAEFIPWFERVCKSKAKSGAKPDGLRAAKANTEGLKYARERGTLLERTAVVNGLVTRLQNFLACIERTVATLAAECAHLPAESIEPKLRDFAGSLRTHLCHVPAELRLSADQAAELSAFLDRLEPPGGAELEAVDA